MTATATSGQRLIRIQELLCKVDIIHSINLWNFKMIEGKGTGEAVCLATITAVKHINVKIVIIGIVRHVMSKDMTAVTTLMGTPISTGTAVPGSNKHWLMLMCQQQ